MGVTSCHASDAKRDTQAESTADAGAAIVRVDPALVEAGRIAVAPAVRRPMKGDIRLSGDVVSSETGEADIGTLVTGRLRSIEVREGDDVKRGQVLAYVDSPEAARVVADVIRARARVLAAERQLERQRALEQDRATSAAAIDQARTELAVAEADVAAARTLLSSLGLPEPAAPSQRVLAARVPVRSLIDGEVVTRGVALGASVSPDKTLFRVLAHDRVVVDARWTDATTLPPAKGTPVTLLARGGDGRTSCAAHVLASIAQVDAPTRARRVRIVADAPCAILVPGAFVDVSLTSASLAAAGAPPLAVPKDAVVDVRGAPTVFVARREPGTFTPRVVRTGRASEEDLAIDDGVVEGELVVVVGAVLLKGELLRAELQ
jgi:cobalt-zinc-cadmium efflux system membrane fusion protein